MLKISAVASFILIVLCVPALQAQTILDGVYTDAQAIRGEASYTGHCSICHGATLDGISAPPLKGDRFLDRWREYTVDAFFNYLKDAMPPARGGAVRSVPDSDYLGIITHILNENGYRSGAAELTADTIAKIMVVGKNGPQPVPDGSLVLTVGCLSQAPNGTWTLVNATEPARNRRSDETTPSELSASAQKQPGTLTFRLSDLEAIPDFAPDTHDGHRMQAKGYLTRQPNAERISLSSIEMVGTSCAP